MLSKLMNDLEKLSLYELTRMKVVIDKLKEDPKKIQAVRQSVQVGQTIFYFHGRLNQEVEGVIIKFNKNSVEIQNTLDRAFWTVPLSALNTVGVVMQHTKVDRCTLPVGAMVGFVSKDIERYGKVLRLNVKTATIEIKENARLMHWRVPYTLLFYVFDSHEGCLTIEGEIEAC